MKRIQLGRLLALVGACAFAWSLLAPAFGQTSFGCVPCASGAYCQRHHCPPALKHCLEGPPHIHYQHGCPRPICNPCDLPNFGYFQTCWSPWPADANWSHCSVLPPAAFVHLGAPQVLSTVPTTPVTPGIAQPVPNVRTLTPTIPSQVIPRPLPGPGAINPQRPVDVEPALPAPRPLGNPGLN